MARHAPLGHVRVMQRDGDAPEPSARLPDSEAGRGGVTSRQRQNDRRELVMAWLRRIHSALVWACSLLVALGTSPLAGADAVLQCREYLCFAYAYGKLKDRTILSGHSDRSLDTVVPFGPSVLSFAKMESVRSPDQVGLRTVQNGLTR